MIYRFTLSHTSGSVVLTRDPGGWKDIVSVIKRDADYHGLFYEFESRKLDFYCDNGKEFIETIYESEGVDAEIGLLIEFSCDGTTYTTYFQGRLNMKTLRKAGLSEREYLSIGVDDAGEVKKALNRFDTVIDLSATESLDGIAILPPTAANITLHSKAIRKEANSIPFEETTSSVTSGEHFTQGDNVYMFPPMYPETSELEGGNTITDNFIVCNTGYGTCTSHAIQEFLEDIGSVDVEFNLSFTIRLKQTDPPNGTQIQVDGFAVYLACGPDISNPETLVSSAPGLVNLNPYDISFFVSGTRNYSVSAGDKLFVLFVLDTGGPTFPQFDIDILSDTSTYINIVGLSTSAETTAKSYYVHEALNQISEAITSESDPFKSNYFGRAGLGYASDGCGAYTAITNGFQIRGFPIIERPVRISMKDMFESLNAIHNLGIGYENNKIVMEPKEYFYENTLLLTLNNVPDIEMSIPQRLYYSTFEFNYEKWQSEELNGLDEFNTRRQYSTGIKAIQTALRVNSKLIGSGYALEFTRRKQYSDSFTEDYKFDNDNFIICLNSAMNAAEKNENFPYINNLISPETAYNLRISPARNALRWSNVLKSAILKAGSNLKFTYGEGNYNLVTAQGDSCNDYTAVEIIGVEEVTNGDFSDLTGGVVVGWKYRDGSNIPDTEVVSGALEIDYSGTNYKGPIISLNSSKTYQITFDASGTETNMYVLYALSGSVQSWDSVIDNGTKTFTFTGADSVLFQGTSGRYIDNVSIKEVIENALTESQDLEFAALKSPIWIPEEYKFKYPITFAQYEIIRNNPKGYIEFSSTETGHTKGFISEVKYQRDTGLTEFTLLRKYE